MKNPEATLETTPDDSPLLDLDYQNPEGYDDIPDEESLTRWLQTACLTDIAYSISVRVVAEQEAKALNNHYRNKDYATNVLSFEFDPPPIPMERLHLGDLILCKQVIEKEAKEQGKKVNDHWAHLIIHGALHLQGYDHLTDAQAEEMENLEINYLNQLGIDNPYCFT